MAEVTDRCAATVYIPEQLRYTGRGKSGFERHYVKRQCRRRARLGTYCRQHADISYRDSGRIALSDRGDGRGNT